MKMAMNLRYMAVVLVFLAAPSAMAIGIDKSKEHKRDRLDLELGTNYFYSDSNYTSSGGGSQGLASGDHFQVYDMYLSTRYMPSKNGSVFGLINIANSESKNGVATRTNSSINEAQVGADFVAYSDLFQVIPEVAVVIPLEVADVGSDKVANGEGVLEVRSRLVMQKNFSSYLGYSWLGFNYRGDERSHLMPWGVGAQYKLNHWRLGAEIFGFQSISDDSSTVSRTSYINNVEAGSLKFYSKNPAIVDSNLYMTWLMSKKWSLQVSGGATLMGANAAAGFHFGAVISYRLDLTRSSADDSFYSPANSDLSSEKRVQHFKDQTEDGVDQSIFQKRPTKSLRPSQPSVEASDFEVKLKPEKKKKKSKKH